MSRSRPGPPLPCDVLQAFVARTLPPSLTVSQPLLNRLVICTVKFTLREMDRFDHFYYTVKWR